MGELRAPWWAWPATVAAAVAAVLGVQLVAVAVLESPPRFLSDYREPAIITAVLVSAAFGVFVRVVRGAPNPPRIFVTISAIALVVSLIPDVAVGMGWVFVREGWTLATVFMLQHVAAWAVVVSLLPQTLRRRV